MEIETIIRMAYLALTLINFLFIFYALYKKKREAKSQEEKDQIDEVIRANFSTALANLKTNLNQLSLRYDANNTKKIFNKLLKEDQKSVNQRTNLKQNDRQANLQGNSSEI